MIGARRAVAASQSQLHPTEARARGFDSLWSVGQLSVLDEQHKHTEGLMLDDRVHGFDKSLCNGVFRGRFQKTPGTDGAAARRSI